MKTLLSIIPILLFLLVIATQADAGCEAKPISDISGQYQGCWIQITENGKSEVFTNPKLTEVECRSFCHSYQKQTEMDLANSDPLPSMAVPLALEDERLVALPQTFEKNTYKKRRGGKASVKRKPRLKVRCSEEGVAENGLVKSEEALQTVFQKIQNDPTIAHRYLEGGCDSRAHLVCDRLKKLRLKPKKIWLELESSPKVNPDIQWTFHVASVISKVDSPQTFVVIDPSLSDKPLTVDEWLDLMDIQTPSSVGENKLSYVKNKILITDAKFLRRSDLHSLGLEEASMKDDLRLAECDNLDMFRFLESDPCK